MRGRRLALGAALLAGVAAAAALTAGLHRVPEGAVAVEAGAEGARMIGPGLHFHLPFTRRTVIYPGAPVKLEALLPLPGGGGDTALPVRAWLAAARGEPESLLRLAPDGDLAGGARSLLEAGFPRRDPPPPARGEMVEWIREHLAPLGLVEGSLEMDDPVAAAAADLTPFREMRRSYQGPDHPVMVIGLDGADWDVMEPLMMAGDLPALQRLRERGAWGVLRSMKPILSPLLWTTMATGRRPDEHGILDFLVTDPATGREIPVTSRHRRAAALWNILTALGRPSLTVAWWATWPAEPVEGAMISDRVAYSLFESGAGTGLERGVHPPALAGEVRDLVVAPRDVGLEEVRRIIGITPGDLEGLKGRLEDPSSWEEPAGHLLRVLASTLTYHRITLELLSRDQPPLAMVYYQGIDEVGHRFAHYAAPAMKWAKAERVEDYGRAVENFYRYQDRLVGQLLEAVDAQTRILVVSDHGFAWGAGRPADVPPGIEGKPGRWHTLDGVILAGGPGVAPGRLPRDPGLLDVAPTVLALLGLPASEGMPGEAIPEIAGDGGGRDRPRIASWDAALRRTAREGPLDTGVDAEMLARLAALGYVDAGAGPGAPDGGAPAGGGRSVTGHLNRGNALLARGKHLEALPAFRDALDLAPGYVPARLGLGQSLIAAGREEEGWGQIEKALREGAGLDPGIYMKVARFYHARGQPGRGARLFEDLPPREGLEAARLVALAILLQSGGESRRALDAVRRGLDLDPTIREGLQLAYDLLTEQGELETLVAILEAARRARPGHEEATIFLALTMERQGELDRAAALLEAHLESSPRSLPALANLAGILLRQGEDRRAAALLRRALEIQPGHPESRVNLVVALGRLGDLDGAEEAFRASGRLAGRVEMINAMASVYQANGRPARARELLERSLKLRPDQPRVRRLLDEIDGEGGQSSAAADSL